MNQQQQFDKALAGLTPAEQVTYKAANPTVGVGEVQQSVTPTGSYTPIEIPKAISSTILTGTQSPYNLPTVNPPSTQGLAMTANSALSGIQTDASYIPPVEDTTATKQKTLLEKYLPGLTTSAEDINTLKAERQAAQSEALVKKQKAQAISTQADQMDKDFMAEIKTIKETSGGNPAGQQAKIAEATSRYQNNRANLALTYKVANEDYQGAIDIVNSKVQTLKDAQDNNLEAYKIQVDAIRNDMSDSEIKKADAIAKEKENNAALVRTAYNDTLNNLAQSGQTIPASVYAAVDAAAKAPNASPASVYAAAEGYTTDIVARQIKEQQLINLGLDAETAKAKLATTTGVSEVTPYQKEKQVRIINAVDKLMGRVNLQTVGIAAIGKIAPGSIQRDFANDLNTLKANIAFGELTAMREASKTGGALGQVSNVELGLLESALAGLDQYQSPSSFKKNLQQVKDSITRWQNVANKVVDSMVVMTGPDGIDYNVPSNQAEAFIKAGGKKK